MIAIRRDRCGSSVISHRKSEGSLGGHNPKSAALSESNTSVRRDDLATFPSVKDSAPPKRLKSTIWASQFIVANIFISETPIPVLSDGILS